MTVDWSSGVNNKILRSGTSWSEQIKFIEDKTRSGKTKRRLAHSLAKRSFLVKMRFTVLEYENFTSWYNNTTMGGLYPFRFPMIDQEGHTTTKVYQFASNGEPQYANISGDMIECTMGWQEV